MNCYVCDSNERLSEAVAVCKHCGVALCRDHFDAELLASRMSWPPAPACTHHPMHAAASRQRPRSVASGVLSSG